MVRLIVTSRAYRQSSLEPPALRERDPENRLYARQGRWRLPAEMVRDNALAVSSLLVRDVGGASVKPYQPVGYYRHLNFPKREYQWHGDSRQYRRGVYVHWQRQFLHPMLKAFDAPSREECTAQRPRSNTPLAALVLLNDPTFVEAARSMAQRDLAEKGRSDANRVIALFRNATSRPPDPTEQKLLLHLLDQSRSHYVANPRLAVDFMDIGYTPKPKDLEAPEVAAWTTLCRAILNLNETMTRE
jgi:hypothetical protein